MRRNLIVIRKARKLCLVGLGIFCFVPKMLAAPEYKTKAVIVAVMDGVRYSETFGDPKRALIPNMAKLENQGTLFVNFYNTGRTITRQAHSTITSGTWQVVPNDGPRQTMPSFCEYARNELGWSTEHCWVIFGKGAYAYAPYSSMPPYGEKFKPSFIKRIGEKTIEDNKKVLDKIFEVMDSDRPRLILANFGTTDNIAHKGDWDGYTEAIRSCDLMFGKLWEKVQNTPGYKDATTIFFTNDHGRHNNKPRQPKDGFQNHFGNCEGCSHIMLLVLGPDTKRSVVIDRRVLLVDICPTVGELLGFQTPLADGEVISDCLVTPLGLNQKKALTPAAKQAVLMKKLAGRDLLKTVAEANLARDATEMTPSPAAELLLRGMISAARVTGDRRYRDFAETWAENHIAESRDNPHLIRILAELGADGNAPPSYLAASKAWAKRWVDIPGKPLSYASTVARVADVTKDKNIMEGVKISLGLAAATEDTLRQEYQKLGLKPPPAASDNKPEEMPAQLTTLADAMRFMALGDAAAAMPENRIVRLACDIQQSACSRGIREIGGVWDDPVVSALVLSEVLAVRKLRRAHPIEWSAATPTAEAAEAIRTSAPSPIPPDPEVFYLDLFPFGYDLLKYHVGENGHYADGTPLSDGAALLLYAEGANTPMPPRIGPIRVIEE